MLPVLPVDDRLICYDAQGIITTAVKNLWRGCAGFLVGGGPSINDLPYHLLADRGVCSLAINAVAAKVPVKAMTFSDPPEKFPEALFCDPGLLKLVPKRKLGRGETRRKMPDGTFEYTGKHCCDYPGVFGFDDSGEWEPSQFLTSTAASFGSNKKGHAKNDRPRIIFTFFSAIRLMHCLGIRRIYLIGVDFYMDPALGVEGNYAFADERFANVEDRDKAAADARAVVDGNNTHYRLANKMLVELRPFLESAGLEIFNCNGHSGLRAFDYVPFDEAMEDCRNGISPGPVDTAGWYQKNERQNRR